MRYLPGIERMGASAVGLVLMFSSAFGGAAAEPAVAAAVRVDAEVPVTPMDQGTGAANNSPTLVSDPTDARVVVLANRLDAPDFSCTLHISGDGGRSWTPLTPVPRLPPGAEKCYAPEAAFDAEGRLYYLFVGLTGRGNEPMGAFLTTSEDRGRTWTDPRRVLGPLNFGVRMAIDTSSGPRGRIHLVWLHATSDPPLGGFGPPPNPILAAHSDDGGATFSDPAQVSDPARQRVVAPALAVGPDRRVHVAYYDLGDDAVDYQGLEGPVYDGTWSVVVASSGDGGRRFRHGVVVDAAVAPHERVMLIFTMPPPALVAGPDRRVCAAWTDARFGDADVLARCSTDGARSWGAARRLNDDARGNGKAQYLPRLGVAPDGRLDAVFLDRRSDPQNLRNHAFYTFSIDGGRRFASNVKLTREASHSQIGQRYANASAAGLYEIGARLGVLSDRRRVVVAWPDTRNSRLNSSAQDVFATTVRLPGPSGGPDSSPAPFAAGAVVLAAGLILFLVGRGRRQRRQGAPQT